MGQSENRVATIPAASRGESPATWVLGRKGAPIKWSTRRIERLAIFLDVENLVHEYRVDGDWEGAVSLLRDALLRFEERGIRVSQVAACDLELSRELGGVLQVLQFDTVVHKGGNDRADRLLLDQLRKTPKETFDTLVIGSGDDIFSDAAAECVRSGKRVEVIAVKGKIGSNLYRVAHDFHPLPGCKKKKAIYPLDNLPVGLAYGGALPFSLYQRYRPRG